MPICSQLGRQRKLPQSDAVIERRVVANASGMLTKAERQYWATQREMLRLVWALRERFYGQWFLLCTDHSCLRWLRNFKEPDVQVARWIKL
ncbi:Retrovirus-related Pol polyprotein from transposon [Trichinella patagoniensis]|uniref:Retrovirus-related Pol polyprotein from transposon n=1 Tax=Trichinella patagoniensis TaxID=990121 RepID=A0A0V0Z4T6_9BILA|nr:Retrovirus-related Pol polyprotein from transposon [Trichinella patagoniensis]